MKFFCLSLICFFSLTLFGVENPPLQKEAATQEPLWEILQATPRFSTFFEGLKKAEFGPLLEGKGPFTLFVPTNEAFAKLPLGTWEKLLQEENNQQLRELLAFHIVVGEIVFDGNEDTTVDSLHGKPLHIVVEGEKITVNDIGVIKVNLLATNGVIQVVENVFSSVAAKT